ncbi:MAG TPA: Wzz/FepE/Etk N-terminal domain-containing protein [Clostridia bacterium]|nr:Wzz/FepE/Etk N-terminal domain-containing protein [Clostridia bacterium]
MDYENGGKFMQDTIDIRYIINLLISKLVWIIAAMLTGILIMFYVASFVITPKYTSSIRLFVDVEDGSSLTKTQLDLSRSLVSTYIVLLESRDSLKVIASDLNTAALSAEDVEKYINMRAVNNTEVLEIEAVTPDPVLSAEICNSFAKNAPTIIENIVGNSRVSVIDTAVVPTKPSSPNVPMYTALGGLLGLILSCGVILLIDHLDNTVKGGEDLSQRYGLPVLGEVPGFHTKDKGGYYSYGSR